MLFWQFFNFSKWHFLIHACNSKFFGAKFFWTALKVPPSDFIQKLSQAPSKGLKQWIKVDRLDYFKNASYHLKNSFCFGCWWISRKTGRQLESPYSFMLKSKHDLRPIFNLKYSKITACTKYIYSEVCQTKKTFNWKLI